MESRHLAGAGIVVGVADRRFVRETPSGDVDRGVANGILECMACWPFVVLIFVLSTSSGEIPRGSEAADLGFIELSHPTLLTRFLVCTC